MRSRLSARIRSQRQEAPSEASFLQTTIKKTGLKVYQHTIAKKVIFDSAKKATSVLVNTNGETYILSSRKEIIVSSGAVSQSRGHMINLYLHPCSFSLPSVTHGLWHRACCNVESKQHSSNLYSRGSWPEPMGISIPEIALH